MGCICEFPAQCDGSGIVLCLGCGGDQCVCKACYGNGEDECPGCEMCANRDYLADEDPAERAAGPEPAPEDE